MVTAAMSIAIGQEPTRITEENDLLEFAVTSGELIIRRLLRVFQLLFVTVVNGNQASLTIVLRLEPLSEVGSPPNSPVPEEQDPSSLHPPLVVNNDENIFFPGHPNFAVLCAPISWRLEKFVFTQTEVLTFLGDHRKTLNHEKKSFTPLSSSCA